MSTQATPEFVEEELSEQAVHDFLAAHPDFFERHSTLLSSLNLPHASGGAISLVERQVSVLRQKELKLERKLRELIEVARQNDVLSAKIHELTLHLLSANDLPGTIAAIEEALRSGTPVVYDPNQVIPVDGLADVERVHRENGRTEYDEPIDLSNVVDTSFTEQALELLGEYEGQE